MNLPNGKDDITVPDETPKTQPQKLSSALPVSEYNDEISLVDLWNVMYKWKKLAGLVILAVFIASIVYILAATRVYESSAVIAIGSTDKIIEDPGLFSAKARERLGIATEASKNKNEANILTLKASANDPELAREKLADAISALLENHAEITRQYNEYLKSNFQLKKTQESKLSALLQQYENRIKAVERQNPSLAAIMTIDRRSLLERILTLQETIEKLEANLMQTTPTEVLREPSTPTSPIKPKTKLVLALSLVSGIFLSIFAAFFAEFVQKARWLRE